jgi:hypothetical protein
MNKKIWYVVDENNNVFAGPIDNLGLAAKTADSITAARVNNNNRKHRFTVIEKSRLDELRKKYIKKINSEHSIFHRLN